MKYYTQEQIDQQGSIIGAYIRNVKSEAIQVTTELGQSESLAISQKLYTDTLGDIGSILDSINGEVSS